VDEKTTHGRRSVSSPTAAGNFFPRPRQYLVQASVPGVTGFDMQDGAADGELVERLRDGDPAAARSLYERYGRAILRFALAMTGCRETAEDIVHDTFVELMRRPPRFEPERGPFVAYLYGIARHRLTRHLRGMAPPGDAPAETGSETLPMQAAPVTFDSAEDEVSREQLIERVRAAIFELPPVHREVIVLCELEELSYQIAAEVLECPIGTVRSRLHRARALLAARLSEAEGASASVAADRTAPRRETDRHAPLDPQTPMLFDYRRTLS